MPPMPPRLEMLKLPLGIDATVHCPPLAGFPARGRRLLFRLLAQLINDGQDAHGVLLAVVHLAFAASIALILTMSLLATYLPARSVSKVDPARVIESP